MTDLKGLRPKFHTLEGFQASEVDWIKNLKNRLND